MGLPPRPIRALPSTPAQESESGLVTGVVTRIVLVATVVLGQLFALTVALEASLLDHDGQAWMLAGFSAVSFVVVVFLARVDAPRRRGRLRGRAGVPAGTYVAGPVGPPVERGDDDRPR